MIAGLIIVVVVPGGYAGVVIPNCRYDNIGRVRSARTLVVHIDNPLGHPAQAIDFLPLLVAHGIDHLCIEGTRIVRQLGGVADIVGYCRKSIDAIVGVDRVKHCIRATGVDFSVSTMTCTLELASY